MNKTITKEEFLNSVSRHSSDGTLGLFIGAGFVKSLSNEAMNWKELINKVGEELSINIEEEWNGFSEPVKFSLIADAYAEKNSIKIEEAQLKVKDIIAKLTNYNIGDCKKYFEIFRKLNPSFVVTTNYDTTIEKILCGRGLSLSVNDIFIKRKESIPVYHIHGIRLKPDSIVATQQDYVQYLRPTNYALNRLPLLFSENFVIIFGYSIHDINVSHAIDYANNLYKNRKGFQIVQIKYVRDGSCKQNLYERDGIWVIESNDIQSLFEEICCYIDNNNLRTNGIIEKIVTFDNGLIEEYIYNNDKRKEINNLIFNSNDIPLYNYPYVYNFINNVFDIVDDQTRLPGNFSAYQTKLKIIMDIIQVVDFDNTPELIIEYIVEQFENVSRYIGYEMGQSWHAKDYWDDIKGYIDKKRLERVKDIINKKYDNGYITLHSTKLLSEILH